MNERILNGFLTIHLKELGLRHVNSEVPEVDPDGENYRPDILAIEPTLRCPVVIEIKYSASGNVIGQLQGYLRKLHKTDPYVFERLASFGKDSIDRLDHTFGYVGLVIAPDAAPPATLASDVTLLWSQWESKGSCISVKTPTLVSRGVSQSARDSSKAGKPRQPGDLLQLSDTELRQFLNEIHFTFTSVAAGVYARDPLRGGYGAYYSGLALDKAFCGYIVPKGVGNAVDVEYHVKPPNHAKFRSSREFSEIAELGIRLGNVRKDLIFPFRVTKMSVDTDPKRMTVLRACSNVARLAHQLAQSEEVQRLSLCPESIGMLSFRNLLKR